MINCHRRNRVTRYALVVLLSFPAACSLRSLVDVDTPDTGGTVDQDVVTSYSGAVGMYYDALYATSTAVSNYTKIAAVMTDELQLSSNSPIGAGKLDALQQLDGAESGFLELSRARVLAARARGALGRYPNQAPRAYIGELFALEGYAHLMLAEGFCSGIPLTTVRYGEDIDYSTVGTTAEVLNAAIALFDSALVYGKDSVAIVTLARVGKGRARLDLADYVGAAEVVTNVSTGTSYRKEYSQGEIAGIQVHWAIVGVSTTNPWAVVNAEGGNGLPWIAPTRATQDPRIPLTTTVPIRQAKYPTSGATTQVVANGIEARLIEAEAQLQPADNPGGPWLTTLNALRATLGVTPTGTRVLADTTDPGDAAGRIRLLFYERAFWLWLTGHRQGDLRRLIRQYGPHGFSVETVYPQGIYVWSAQSAFYGTDVTLSPPLAEVQRNPSYNGCFNREP